MIPFDGRGSFPDIRRLITLKLPRTNTSKETEYLNLKDK